MYHPQGRNHARKHAQMHSSSRILAFFLPGGWVHDDLSESSARACFLKNMLGCIHHPESDLVRSSQKQRGWFKGRGDVGPGTHTQVRATLHSKGLDCFSSKQRFHFFFETLTSRHFSRWAALFPGEKHNEDRAGDMPYTGSNFTKNCYCVATRRTQDLKHPFLSSRVKKKRIQRRMWEPGTGWSQSAHALHLQPIPPTPGPSSTRNWKCQWVATVFLPGSRRDSRK